MEHSFDINIASEIGLEESIMMKHFIFWIKKTKQTINTFTKVDSGHTIQCLLLMNCFLISPKVKSEEY